MTKTFTLSKEERTHFEHLDYAQRYLQESVNQFIAAVITERLGEKPDPMQQVDWKLEDGKLVLEVTEREPLYRPDNSE